MKKTSMYALIKNGFFLNRLDDNGRPLFESPEAKEKTAIYFIDSQEAEYFAKMFNAEVVEVARIIEVHYGTTIGQPGTFEVVWLNKQTAGATR